MKIGDIDIGQHPVMLAPMEDVTDRSFRLICKEQGADMVYTEFVSADALIRSIAATTRKLHIDPAERPTAIQIYGREPGPMVEAAKIVEAAKPDVLDINFGCPVKKVAGKGAGAGLLRDIPKMLEITRAVVDAVKIPVTVKTRIGIDDQDSYEFLCDFINTVSGKGECEMFIIHARKAWLSGLSPKENREIPPLDYPRVYQLKRDFPHLTMSINGGIKSLEEAKAHLQHMDGVMVGREAYQNPGILAAVDREIFGSSDTDADPVAVVRAMYPYIERELSQGTYLGHITRHMLGLFQGIPGARQWRRYLSENAHKAGADINVLEHALKLVADKR